MEFLKDDVTEQNHRRPGKDTVATGFLKSGDCPRKRVSKSVELRELKKVGKQRKISESCLNGADHAENSFISTGFFATARSK